MATQKEQELYAMLLDVALIVQRMHLALLTLERDLLSAGTKISDEFDSALKKNRVQLDELSEKINVFEL